MAGHAHGNDHGHGHAHVDTSGDKGAAFTGIFVGMVVLGGMIFGMVKWTNSRYAHEAGERPAAAEATR